MTKEKKQQEPGAIAMSDAILEALAARHPSGEWLFVLEVALPGGLSRRRIDAAAMAYWPSRKYVRHIYEIKVSRQDFQRELKAPEKRQFALASGEHFWFAVPEGLVKKAELPPEAGLLEWDGKCLHVAVPAPQRMVEPASPEFMLALSRRAVHSGRRDVASRSGIPGWGAIRTALRIAVGKQRHAQDVYRHNAGFGIVQALRGAGFADEARDVEQMMREGDKYEAFWQKAVTVAALEELKRQHPVPASCPDCGGAPERSEQSVFDFLCPACGWTDSAINIRRIRK